MSTGTQMTTKDRILLAALRLFGELGYTATSMRAITEAAGVNIALVNYHFGGKAALLRAVTVFAMAGVNAERERRLDDLQAREIPPTPTELVEAFVLTGVTITDRADGYGPDIAKFLGRVVCDPSPEIRRLFATEIGPVEGSYLEALKQALPELTTQDVEFRYRAMIGLLALHQAGTLTELLPGAHSTGRKPTAAAETRQLLHTITAIFGQ